jgi:hypothetical protein
MKLGPLRRGLINVEKPIFENSKAVDLDGVLPVLSQNVAFLQALKRELGEVTAKEATRMIQKGKLSGPLGATIADFLTDEIHNESVAVWSSYTFDPDDEMNEDAHAPIEVKEYHGVFYVYAQEFEEVGYFLRFGEALAYLQSNWENIASVE